MILAAIAFCSFITMFAYFSAIAVLIVEIRRYEMLQKNNDVLSLEEILNKMCKRNKEELNKFNQQ